MGYCMEQRNCKNFLIKKEKFNAALKAIKALKGQETITDGSGRHFSWVDHNFAEMATLEETVRCWRWELKIDDAGNAVEIEFLGEKLGDDEILFRAIAPFVEHGEIEMMGEDGSFWKWVFSDGKCREHYGRVVY